MLGKFLQAHFDILPTVQDILLILQYERLFPLDTSKGAMIGSNEIIDCVTADKKTG